MGTKIPKIIHYCWFGGNKKPDDVIDFIEGWKKLNPEYEIIEWNEENFDMRAYPYAQEAYDSKRFAFVTDIVRLYALKTHGGIYMDTDVEVIKPLDPYLNHDAFTGCENEKMCVTGTMGAAPNNRWVTTLLNYYDGKHFLNEDGKQDLTTNTKSITNITIEEFGWKEKDDYQELSDVAIYPSDVFCAKSYKDGTITITDDTTTIHHFKGSWKSDKEKMKSKSLDKIKSTMIKIFGEKNFERINRVRKSKK